ncbi:Asp-tRNA(Asn)/Glu-tRNA(Gln) amidotransferase subunit GatA [Akkermansiaceae bacterium]|nr:Asp-tRNA(Asn)/Glu-tRNA(Gln) amidotransferase subunit GatA [Akkermansiaceae bacterium]MDB4328001.1 Asp-tRNA(Asn)/Glu-tRNA(Gln) amidotransferase subunit GatA [Akkermansiaceae bacterium]MDB4540917.1 Asp-tRNA(Asn)/Glu-tRNA(Gln) amidotransferase subunit GatA [Akkermansiaceae bacterium]MDC1405797.1 Asp-tRNA(Asn)/Glu-tRNA(Gln) amidotransferase subunit GatA [Akkermansiaceae bacterium]
MSLAAQTLSSLRRQLTAGDISSRDIVEDAIAQVAARDGEIGAFISHDPETALAEAEKADLSLPLGGLPIGIKDNINVLGQPCTCASKFLQGAYTSPYDATVIKNLRAAGAIPFGRANLDEFAMGSSTENSALQVTNNPAAPGHIPGGSSGGSAAAVAGMLVPAALGSDTGGSIRQPASHCGVVGLKPSYGRVSRYGLVAFGSSLDQIGPLTRSVEDAALLLGALAGPDPRDSTCLDADVPDYTEGLDAGVAGMKLGLPKEYFTDGIDPRVRERVEKAAKDLEAQGAEIVEISLPHTEYATATYYIIAPAEASSNLSRFDGIRYGNRTENPADILSLYQQSREEGFGSEVKRRIILGTYVLSSGYYDAYYTRALKVRTLIRQDFEQAFKKVDAILTPVSPEPATKIGAASGDPLKHYLSDIFTISANLAENCGISVPLEPVDGLPVGLQILGPHMGEKTILKVARTVEGLS